MPLFPMKLTLIPSVKTCGAVPLLECLSVGENSSEQGWSRMTSNDRGDVKNRAQEKLLVIGRYQELIA